MSTLNPQLMIALGAEHERELNATPIQLHLAFRRLIGAGVTGLTRRASGLVRLRPAAHPAPSLRGDLAAGEGTAQ
jgi:hypothetical protein